MARTKTKIERSINTKALGFQIRESYKTARTNIAYSIIKRGCKKIAFTSSSKSEGKTVTSMNVASALAQHLDTKVLVIDCDLRRPQVHTALKLTPTPGLTNYLNEECSIDDIIKDTRVENLKAVCYGAVPPNPSELLASDSMKEFIKTVEKEYDYIIFDTPPIGIVIDAVPIIQSSDGVVVVVKNNSTTYPDLYKTLDSINRSGGKTLGIIINKIKPSESKKFHKTYNQDNDYYGYGY